MTYISVDIEADGPNPGDYSMISIGAIVVEPSLSKTFYRQLKPISEKWIPEALAISGFSREETMKFDEPLHVMHDFGEWVKQVSDKQSIFMADNPGFDFAWINWYFHHFVGKNPFGWSSRRIGDIYCGMQKDVRAQWKHLRKTQHDHNALADAKGNAEALLEMEKMGLKIKFL